jgi:hypothetical protein
MTFAELHKSTELACNRLGLGVDSLLLALEIQLQYANLVAKEAKNFSEGKKPNEIRAEKDKLHD